MIRLLPSNPNEAFELLNGVQFLLIALFSIFLMSYLIEAANRDGLTLKGWWCSTPLRYQVATSLLVSHLGYGSIRLAAWLWRMNGAGKFTMFQNDLLTFGIALSTIGVLCMIRVFTKPFYGHWPWVASAIASALYVVFGYLSH